MPDEVLDDRRAAIEAAFEQEEKAASTTEASTPPMPAPVPAESTSTETVPVITEPETKSAVTEPTSETKEPVIPVAPSPQDPIFNVEKAPQSWRAPQREKWAKLDPDVRQEIVRRERDITKTLGETAQARQFQSNFVEVVQPYMARIQSLGVAPLAAIHELLKADHVLTTSPKAQRAQYMAKLITDYDVDILELDAALAGKAPVNPVDSRVEALLQERLAPMQQFIESQRQQAMRAEQESGRQVTAAVNSMSDNPKFPHFEAVRQDMADLVEVSARRGRYLTLEQAYVQAVAMNPEVSAQVAQEREANARKTAAAEANRKAQQSLQASSSVSGAPGGTLNGASGAEDRRSVIAAAFDSVGGR